MRWLRLSVLLARGEGFYKRQTGFARSCILLPNAVSAIRTCPRSMMPLRTWFLRTAASRIRGLRRKRISPHRHRPSMRPPSSVLGNSSVAFSMTLTSQMMLFGMSTATVRLTFHALRRPAPFPPVFPALGFLGLCILLFWCCCMVVFLL